MELDKLYNIYHSNISLNDKSLNENIIPIKRGDILVALHNNREVRGEVDAVFEKYYVLKGKNGSTLKVTLDDITEHFPKNRTFENKNVKKQFESSSPILEKPIDKPIQKIDKKVKDIEKDEEKKELKNSPENSIDKTLENVKRIGKILFYNNITYKDVNKMFEKKLLNKEQYWYLMTEKPGEIHVVRNNEKAFEIQPFINSLMGHFLKNQDKLIKESYSKIKTSGNINFSVITNIPQNIQVPLKNNIIGLLCGIKK